MHSRNIREKKEIEGEFSIHTFVNHNSKIQSVPNTNSTTHTACEMCFPPVIYGIVTLLSWSCRGRVTEFLYTGPQEVVSLEILNKS